jgi:hypothetical protein
VRNIQERQEADECDENQFEEKKKSAVGELLQSHGYAFSPNPALRDLDATLLQRSGVKKSAGFRAPDF